jgi:hypothetical protein
VEPKPPRDVVVRPEEVRVGVREPGEMLVRVAVVREGDEPG